MLTTEWCKAISRHSRTSVTLPCQCMLLRQPWLSVEVQLGGASLQQIYMSDCLRRPSHSLHDHGHLQDMFDGVCSTSTWLSVKKSPSSAQQRAKQRQQPATSGAADGSLPLSPWAGPQAEALRTAISCKVDSVALCRACPQANVS